MSLFEIIGESHNPGPVGQIKFKDEGKKPGDKYILAKFLISLLIIIGFEFMLYSNPLDLYAVLILNAVFSLYLIIGYLINIRPNLENTGWVPFLIDNPFRFSDDINRFLVILDVLFMPGKFIAKSLVGFYRKYRKE